MLTGVQSAVLILGEPEAPRRLLSLRYASELGTFLNADAELGLICYFNTLKCSKTHINVSCVLQWRIPDWSRSEACECVLKQQVKRVHHFSVNSASSCYVYCCLCICNQCWAMCITWKLGLFPGPGKAQTLLTYNVQVLAWLPEMPLTSWLS